MAVPGAGSPADGPASADVVAPAGPRGTRARRAAQESESAAPMLPFDGAWERDGAHWYFFSFSVIAIAALAVVVLLVPFVVLWRQLWPLLIFGPVILPCVLLARSTELTIAPEGVEYLGRQYRWEVLELADSDLGEVLRTRRDHSKRHTMIYLRMYSRDWRAGAIGHDLRTWAPSLMPEALADDA